MPPKRKGNKKSPVPCLEFLNEGTCRRGDACSNTHYATRDEVPLCKTMILEGGTGCSKGSKCRFNHDPQKHVDFHKLRSSSGDSLLPSAGSPGPTPAFIQAQREPPQAAPTSSTTSAGGGFSPLRPAAAVPTATTIAAAPSAAAPPSVNERNYQSTHTESAQEVLQCPKCTFFNKLSDQSCSMCGFSNLATHGKKISNSSKSVATRWFCKFCQEANPEASPHCVVCGTLRTYDPQQSVARRQRSRINRSRAQQQQPTASPTSTTTTTTTAGGSSSFAPTNYTPSDILSIDDVIGMQRQNSGDHFQQVWDPRSSEYQEQVRLLKEFHDRKMRDRRDHSSINRGNSSSQGGRDTAPTTRPQNTDYCVICLDQPATRAVLPCGHNCFCAGSCADNFESSSAADDGCPVCRQPFDRIANSVVVGTARSSALPTPRVPPSSSRLPASRQPPTSSPDDDDTVPFQPTSMTNRTGQPWVPPPSTFPWIGGELSAWPRFLSEIKASATEQMKRELERPWNLQRDLVIESCFSEGEPGYNNNNSGAPSTALTRFKQGWQLLACPESTWSGIFAWHGTQSLAALDSIVSEGWSVDHRRRNNHGPGEYFGLHHSQVFEYVHRHHHDVPHTLIYSFVLRGAHLSWVENFCLVVDNPSEGEEAEEATYCLPLFKVTFPNATKEKRWNLPSPEKVPFRWQFLWENDDNNGFIPYEMDLNLELVRCKCDHYAGKTDDEIIDRELYPYVAEGEGSSSVGDPYAIQDQTTVQYRIDLTDYTQMNLDTGFSRKLDIMCVPAIPLPKTLWVAYFEPAGFQPSSSVSPAATVATGGSSFPSVNTGTEVWLVLDLFAQRELSEGYFNYRPDELLRRQGGDPTQERRVNSRRYMNLRVFTEQFFVDFERLRLRGGTHQQARRNPGGITRDEFSGRALAVVEA